MLVKVFNVKSAIITIIVSNRNDSIIDIEFA